MPRATFAPRLAGAITAVLLLGSGVATGAASAAPRAAQADPMTGAPAVGSCYDISRAQAARATLTEQPVRCGDSHTATVVGVAKLPSSLTWDSGETALQAAMSRACEKALQATIGDNPLLRYRSQYIGLYFRPTTAQADAGARWISCLAAAPQDRGLGALPRRLPELSKRMPDSVARCVTGTRTYQYTTCADRHGWRSTYAFYVDGRPTERNVDRASRRVCSRHTTGRTWLQSVLVVNKSRFIMGCYTKTSR